MVTMTTTMRKIRLAPVPTPPVAVERMYLTFAAKVEIARQQFLEGAITAEEYFNYVLATGVDLSQIPEYTDYVGALADAQAKHEAMASADLIESL